MLVLPINRDIRPTFLFWSRGQPTALLRGANRPLLTRLIIQEVELLLSNAQRIDIDFTSEKVIQCTGNLSELANDQVVQSIGNGNTDKLTNLLSVCELTAPIEEEVKEKEEPPNDEPIDESNEITDDQEGEPLITTTEEEFFEQEMSTTLEVEMEIEDYYDEGDEITERVELEMVNVVNTSLILYLSKIAN